MREYKLNSEMPWEFGDPAPEVGRAIWALIEEDTCDPTQSPGILRLIAEENGEYYKYRLLDFDPERQEEYLNSNYINIVAWRYMTDHAGTYDEILSRDYSGEMY